MELAYKINDAFANGRNPLWKELNQLSIDVFGESLKDRCTSCIPDLIKRLKKYAQSKMPKSQGKYRFTKAWEKKKVVVTIGGTSVVVTADTLSIATAEAILNSGQYRKDIVELNPDYNGADVKKNLLAQPEPMPILSTLHEAEKGGKESKGSVSAKESVTSESKPLTVEKKKQEKPSK